MMQPWMRLALGLLLLFGWAPSAQAYPYYGHYGSGSNPPGTTDFGVGAHSSGCEMCHTNTGGGLSCAGGFFPCLNPFGLAYFSNGGWTTSFGNADSDADGQSNLSEVNNTSRQPGFPRQASSCDLSDCASTLSDDCSGGGTGFNITCNRIQYASGRYSYTYSFSCDNAGYDSDFASDESSWLCSDINECSTSNPCGEDNTFSNNACSNTAGSWSCDCNAGYTEFGSVAARTNGCSSNNECSTGDPCSVSGLGNNICTELTGSYDCSCDSGYNRTGSITGVNRKCLDIDECSANNYCGEDYSDSDTSCVNQTGGFSCECGVNEGFTAAGSGNLGQRCNDINECNEENHCREDDFSSVNSCSNTSGGYRCSCGAGFQLSGSAPRSQTCQDIDECAQNSGLCGRTGTFGSGANVCTNVDGGYSCSCIAGFTHQNSGAPATNRNQDCIPIDECVSTSVCGQNLGPGGTNTCTNLVQGYSCSCQSPQFSATGSGSFDGDCVDVNECTDGGPSDNTCHQEDGWGSCTNYTGSGSAIGYGCTCGAGFTRINAGTTSEDCADINECTDESGADTSCNAHLGYGSCNNTTGGYSCTCADGYESFLDGGDPSCRNVDECSDEAGADTSCNAHLGFGTCTDTDGGFTCSCDTANGYAFDAGAQTCVLENECTNPANNNCDVNATCTDTPTGFTCSCDQGWTGSGTSCSNVDECAVATQCGQNLGGGGINTCIDTSGGFTCVCGPGFSAQGSGFTATCVNQNECSDTPGICGAGSCTDLEGSYSCNCPEGYSFSGGTCQNIDECGNSSTCGQDLGAPGTNTCTDLTPGYSCVCDSSGYDLSGSGFSAACIDRDECAQTNPCSVGSCDNSVGGYSCNCPSGYIFQNGTCEDVDECVLSPCGSNATGCNNIGGSYECACATGYAAPAAGGSCADIDECVVSAPCGSNSSSCSNRDGTYSCACSAGYSAPSQGGTCANINECAETPDICGVGSCEDDEGSYSCSCPEGYSAPVTAGTCENVDECTETPGVCGSNASRCSDSEGSYVCECESGYEAPASGGSCINIDECSIGTPCDPGNCSDLEGTYSCSCPEGFAVASGTSGPFCVDIDECLGDPCGPGTCFETGVGGDSRGFGDYFCVCNAGYVESAELNGVCQNVDECLTPEVSLCPSNSTCTDTDGRWECPCDIGFEYDVSGTICINVDECALGLDDCAPVTATCSDLTPVQADPRRWECSCNVGYQGSGVTCVDIDECAIGTPCGENELCVNRLSGEQPDCRCRPGYTRNEESLLCELSCGDGTLGQTEVCDDGNSEPGDGCSDACLIEPGYVCLTPGASCLQTCGDGVLQTHEECDDGDENSDTAADACRLSGCVFARCGDGVIDTGEACDDGDMETVEGMAINSDRDPDACRTDCSLPRCGDGVVDTGELCDPGILEDEACTSEVACGFAVQEPPPDASAVALDASSPDAGSSTPASSGGGCALGGRPQSSMPRTSLLWLVLWTLTCLRRARKSAGRSTSRRAAFRRTDTQERQG